MEMEKLYTSYIATILSSMCMDYVSLAWLDSIPHVRALLQTIITLHGRVCGYMCVEVLIVMPANV